MEPKLTDISQAEFNQMIDALEQEIEARKEAVANKIKSMTPDEYKAWHEQTEKTVLTKPRRELTPAEREVWNEVMKKRKIASCTAVDSEFIESKDENCYDAYYMIMQDLSHDEDSVISILNDCANGRARLIYYYPPCDTEVQDNWEWLAEIPDDGSIYLERIKG